MKNIFLLIFLNLITISFAKSQCADYTHYSTIDCEYDVHLIGFLCDTTIKPWVEEWSPNQTGHSHFVYNATVICPGNCGCWDNPGSLDHSFGCGLCWDPDADLCTNAQVSGDPYRILGIKFSWHVSPPAAMLMDWRDRDDFETNFGYRYETTICCFGYLNPNDCNGCACGTAEVNWENGNTWLRPAHDPYYPPCEEP